MSISSLVCRGFGTFANGLLVTLGFGQPTPVGPGVCGDGFSISESGVPTVLAECGVGYSLDLGAGNSIVFSGAHDGATIPVGDVGEYA